MPSRSRNTVKIDVPWVVPLYTATHEYWTTIAEEIKDILGHPKECLEDHSLHSETEPALVSAGPDDFLGTGVKNPLGKVLRFPDAANDLDAAWIAGCPRIDPFMRLARGSTMAEIYGLNKRLQRFDSAQEGLNCKEFRSPKPEVRRLCSE